VTGPLLLQGGGELSPGCREMDRALLERAPGPVAVLPLASTPGRDHDLTLARATSYYEGLGQDLGVEVLPATGDPLARVAAAAVVVLTGGSPSRLRRALVGTPLGTALAEHVRRGGAVSGSSAGAMLLGAWTVLPEEGHRLDTGLGLAGDVVVVPHWDGPRQDWLAAIHRGADRCTVLGLPEESGVLVEGDGLTAVGRFPSVVVGHGGDVRVVTRSALFRMGPFGADR